MPKSIYINYQGNKISKTNLIIWSALAFTIGITSTLYFSNVFIRDISSYLICTILPLAVILFIHYYQNQGQQKNFVLITEENISILNKHKDSVLMFMGAGDIQKFQHSYEKTV